jgi:hypothetical protein
MKIPVGKTLEAAFTFLFRNFLSVIGTVWFPMLVAIVLVAAVAILSFAGMSGNFSDIKDNQALLLQILPRLIGIFAWFCVVVIVIGAMIQVGLLRKALGQHPSPVFIYFSLGGDVWRMIGAMFLVFIISMGLALGFTAAGFAVYGIAHVGLGEPGSYWLTALAGIAFFCAYFYALVRLSYFLPVVVVAEHHIGIGRAWELSRGNFWRIIALSIVLSLAVNIVVGIIQSAFAPPFAMTIGQQTDPADLLKLYMSYMHSMAPLLAITTMLQSIFLYGLMAGAAANAYRAVMSPPEGTQPA